MSDEAAPAPQSADDTAGAMAAYLRAHPRFLDEHPDVLAALDIPHRVPGAISLVSRQVAALRSEKHRLEESLAGIAHAAEENQKIVARLVRLACRLLSPDGLTRTEIEALIVREFELDQARLVLSVPSARLSDGGEDDAPTLALTPVLPERPLTVFRPLAAETAERLFADGHEYSAAFVPLVGARGWMILAARDPHRFHPGLGTLYLNWLGEILDARLAGA